MRDTRTITLRVEAPTPTTIRYVTRTLGFTATQMAVVGVGVMTDSAAMQWLGLTVWWLGMFGAVMIRAEANKGLTIDEARSRLDEIEQGRL
jgi:hypothetical protein